MAYGRDYGDVPPVRGTYTYDAPLKDLVWFRAGGAAEMGKKSLVLRDIATSTERALSRRGIFFRLSRACGEKIV